MAKGLTDSQHYTDIAAAIRAKKGTTETLTPGQMAAEISGIFTAPTLQDKTVTPSSEQQIITADEGFDGLSTVTVEAAVVGSLSNAEETTFGYVKKTETVTEQAPEGKCWYNGVLLPEIPADVLASYPYAWIRNNTTTGYYDLILTKVAGYYDPDAGSNPGVVYGAGAAGTEALHYRVSITNADSSTSWEYKELYSNTWFGLDTARTVLWSNHDIPNGSATATEIYFKGSEPLTELTETVTKLVPVERESEYSITSESLNNIAKRTQEMAGTTKLMTPGDIIYFLNSAKFIPQSTATSEFTLEFEANADSRLPTVIKGTANSEFILTFESTASG